MAGALRLRAAGPLGEEGALGALAPVPGEGGAEAEPGAVPVHDQYGRAHRDVAVQREQAGRGPEAPTRAAIQAPRSAGSPNAVATMRPNSDAVPGPASSMRSRVAGPAIGPAARWNVIHGRAGRMPRARSRDARSPATLGATATNTDVPSPS